MAELYDEDINVKRHMNGILVTGNKTKELRTDFRKDELRGNWNKKLGGWMFAFSKRHVLRELILSKYPHTTMPVSIFAEQLAFLSVSPETIDSISILELNKLGVVYSKRLQKYIIHVDDKDALDKLITKSKPEEILKNDSIIHLAKQEYISGGITSVKALQAIYPETSIEHRTLQEIIQTILNYNTYKDFFQ